MSIFHPLEVVGRSSETQLQVGGNLNFNVALYPSAHGPTLEVKI